MNYIFFKEIKPIGSELKSVTVFLARNGLPDQCIMLGIITLRDELPFEALKAKIVELIP
jgi:hypothetical protein